MKILVALCVLAVGANAQVGPSGIVDPKGGNVQFSHDFANNIVVIGPSGIVTADGKNLQLTDSQAAFYAAHHAAPVHIPAPIPVSHYVTSDRHLVGPSGLVWFDGRPNEQFSQDFADNIVLIGPSGIVTKNGMNRQL